MNQQSATNTFSHWDKQGRYIYTLSDLSKLFPNDKPKTLKEGVNRLVKSGLLTRVGKGTYLYTHSSHSGANTIEHIAKTLRRGEYNYVSLESALSEYGAISQIPIDHLTVMTTGRKGTYKTPYGTIEFTHTKRAVSDILKNVLDVNRPLRFAKANAAWRDLKRVGRNLHLVDEKALAHD
ncbi:type IV toxin-antitoxin system AbiEi family antitoxin [Leucothrix arctica]|uniref:Transcriptional regulator, AbiEi antitoxin, Type IV TA system n=1 Tax=Leucothrix arctica TaxID=1481894 RepID=A0A317CM25_9GAMM|nr:hypothetical protein [Leucothrix arctica]PWQ99576.1 hypothetical protein DKT75_00455 [Leucothrix arctica]